MAYNIVSESGRLLQYGSLFSMLNQDLLDTQARIATGKKATTYGGLGASDATLSQSYRATQSTTDVYTKVIAQLKTRTDTMDQMMTSTNDSATSFIATLKGFGRSANQTNFAGNFSQLQSQAKGLLNELTTRLNIQQGGRYLFSGDLVSTAPVADNNLANSNISLAIGNYGPGSASTVIGYISGLTTDQLGYDTNLKNANAVKTRVENGYDANYGVKADNSGFNDLIKGLSTIANLPYNSAADSDFWSIFDNATSRLTTGSQALSTATGKLGATRQLISNITDQHQLTLTSLETSISGVEDSDVTRDSTKMYALQNQLQAAYTITSKLTGLTLLNYLK